MKYLKKIKSFKETSKYLVDKDSIAPRSLQLASHGIKILELQISTNPVLNTGQVVPIVNIT